MNSIVITREHRKKRVDVRPEKTPRHPVNIFRSYRKILRKYLNELQEIAAREVLTALPEILQRQDANRLDTNDALLGIVLRNALLRWGEIFPREVIAADVGSIVEGVARYSAREAKRVLSTNFVSSLNANAIFQKTLDENIQLITKLTHESLFGSVDGTRLGVKQVIERGFEEGKLTADIAKDMERRFSVSRSRAEFIARDQIGTVNASLTADRFRTAGVLDFVWVTAGDNAVREEHAILNGDVYSYASGGHPTEGLPGEPINCRCAQQPVIPGIDE